MNMVLSICHGKKTKQFQKKSHDSIVAVCPYAKGNKIYFSKRIIGFEKKDLDKAKPPGEGVEFGSHKGWIRYNGSSVGDAMNLAPRG